jgi:hypothetical protein
VESNFHINKEEMIVSEGKTFPIRVGISYLEAGKHRKNTAN